MTDLGEAPATFSLDDVADPVEVFESYQGAGQLTSVTGAVIPGTFHLAQLHAAHLVGVFREIGGTPAPALRGPNTQWTLSGVTPSGGRLQSTPLATLAPARDYKHVAPSDTFLIGMAGLRASFPISTETTAGYRYVITNFIFAPSIRRYRRLRKSGLLLDVPIPGQSQSLVTVREPDGSSILIAIAQHPDIDAAILRLRIHRRSRVTALVYVPAARTDGSAITPEQADDVLGRLARVMSLGTGSRVQWIARETMTNHAAVSERLHISRLTGWFSPIPIIRIDKHVDVMRFLEQAYPNYTARRGQFRLDTTSDAYLGAREQHTDFMETRALRLAVALEALRDALSAHSGGRSEFLGDLEHTAALSLVSDIEKSIRAALDTTGVPRSALADDALRGRCFQLVRKAFREQITRVVSELGIQPLPNEEIGAFIKSRDSLVHRGRFASDNENTESLSQEERSALTNAEFWSDFHVLDRIYMGLLGYRGEFVDARDTTGGTMTRVAYTRPAPAYDGRGYSSARD